MEAPGALNSLLGRLTTVLINKAQLLGGVRGDVEFIKDEMESMNALLLHLTETQHNDHQVRAWMKQVAGLARDCEGNVQLYVHYVGSASGGKGIFGVLLRLPRFLRTVRVRHQIATRIRELKVRAHHVGERRFRYGVTVPELGTHADNDVDTPWTRGYMYWESLVFDDEFEKDRDKTKEGIDTLVKWLHDEELPPQPAAGAAAGENGVPPRLRVFAIAGTLSNKFAEQLYFGSFSLGLNDLFDIKERQQCRREKQDARETVRNILRSMVFLEDVKEVDDCQLFEKVQKHLKGKRSLIILQNVDTTSEEWQAVLDTLLHEVGVHSDSAIVITTDNYDKAKSLSPDKIVKCESYAKIVHDRAKKLDEYLLEQHRDSYHKILDVIYPDIFVMKMFQHLLLCNRTRIGHELEKYLKTFEMCKQQEKSIPEQMIMFCYNKLPSKYRSCLLYLTIFPKGNIIRATSLVRRWMSEGLIATSITSDDTSWLAKDEAECYFYVLANRGFLDYVEIRNMGGIKSFKVHDEVHKFITRTARDVNFVDSDLPLNLAPHFSIHNRMELQKSHSDADSNDIVAFLPTLAASSQWQLLKVLDLEDCKLLKNHHLKSICNILLLKYLSLRNTGIAYLPKKIKELQCLETLDIRQTKIRIFAKKAVVLPQLKHFLSGHKVSSSNDLKTLKESFPTMCVPFDIQRMKNLEILYHIHFANSNSELAGIGQLQKLRKLGVDLHGENAKLSVLFHQINKLYRCLRSLSVRIHRPAENHGSGTTDVLPMLQPYIESLNISGIVTGFAHLFLHQYQLVKVTLSETLFKEGDLRILGKLPRLRCLRLQHRSYNESSLAFKEDEFQSLNFLLVEGSEITKITFVNGAAPKLKKIIWSFATMDGISGLIHLPKLTN